MNKELMESMNILEKEYNISKDTLYPIRFVGSLANSYATILREVAGEFGIGLDVIEETPMNGLIEFHSLNIEEP